MQPSEFPEIGGTFAAMLTLLPGESLVDCARELLDAYRDVARFAAHKKHCRAYEKAKAHIDCNCGLVDAMDRAALAKAAFR